MPDFPQKCSTVMLTRENGLRIGDSKWLLLLLHSLFIDMHFVNVSKNDPVSILTLRRKF